MTDILSEYSPAQQAVIQGLLDSPDNTLPKEGIHTLTIKALLGEGLINVTGELIELSDAGCDEFCKSIPVGGGDEDPLPVPVSIEGDDVKTKDEVMIHQLVTLADDMQIQVDKKGKLVRIPAGTTVPVLSYHEERTRKGQIKWFTVIFPPTMTIFQVNSLRNKSHPIEATPLSEI